MGILLLFPQLLSSVPCNDGVCDLLAHVLLGLAIEGLWKFVLLCCLVSGIPR